MQIFDKCFKTVIQNFFTVYVASTKHKGVYWRSCLKFSQTRECSTKLCKPRWGSLILKCTCNVSKLIAEGGGGSGSSIILSGRQTLLLCFTCILGHAKLFQIIVYHVFLTWGGKAYFRTLATPPPPPLGYASAKYGQWREFSFIVLRRSYNLHLYVMSDLCGLFFPPVFSLFIENPPPPRTPHHLCPPPFLLFPSPPFTKKVEKANFNLLSSWFHASYSWLPSGTRSDMRTWTKKENHFNIGLSIVSKVKGKQEIVGRHAGSGKHHVLSGVRWHEKLGTI